jgi:hypothetical protein
VLHAGFYLGLLFGSEVEADTKCDNKVRELAIVCLPCQQWAETSVWFNDFAYQRFTAVFLLIYDSLFLSGVYYCLCVFWYAVERMSELELEHCL